MKHLIDLDEQALAGAKLRLGTDTLKDTVNTALRRIAGPTPEEVARIHESIRELATIEFRDRPEAWREFPRILE